MKKSLLFFCLLLATLVGRGQSKPKVKDTANMHGLTLASSGMGWFSNQMQGSEVIINFAPAPTKAEIGVLGSLNNNGKWVIKDTIGLLNALYKDIIIRNKLYEKELERREWPYRERELAQKVFIAINEMNQNKVKIALHNYLQFIRTHQ